MPYGPNLLLVA